MSLRSGEKGVKEKGFIMSTSSKQGTRKNSVFQLCLDEKEPVSISKIYQKQEKLWWLKCISQKNQGKHCETFSGVLAGKCAVRQSKSKSYIKPRQIGRV